jgi:hypothetical protein
MAGGMRTLRISSNPISSTWAAAVIEEAWKSIGLAFAFVFASADELLELR